MYLQYALKPYYRLHRDSQKTQPLSFTASTFVSIDQVGSKFGQINIISSITLRRNIYELIMLQ